MVCLQNLQLLATIPLMVELTTALRIALEFLVTLN